MALRDLVRLEGPDFQVWAYPLDADWADGLLEQLVAEVGPDALVAQCTQDELDQASDAFASSLDVSTGPRAFSVLFAPWNSASSLEQLDRYALGAYARVYAALTGRPKEEWPRLRNLQRLGQVGLPVVPADVPACLEKYIGVGRPEWDDVSEDAEAQVFAFAHADEPTAKSFVELRKDGARLCEDFLYPPCAATDASAESVHWVLEGYEPDQRVLAFLRKDALQVLQHNWRMPFDAEHDELFPALHSEPVLGVRASRGLAFGAWVGSYSLLRWRKDGFPRQSRLAKWARRAVAGGGLLCGAGAVASALALSRLELSLRDLEQKARRFEDNPQVRWHVHFSQLGGRK